MLSLLAQVLLLDELTTFLDADDQRSVLDAIRAAVDGPQRVTALWVRRLAVFCVTERRLTLDSPDPPTGDASIGGA
jgi:hypothetical protein